MPTLPRHRSGLLADTFLVSILLLLPVLASGWSATPARDYGADPALPFKSAPARIQPVRVLARHPHRADAFTQGLAVAKGRLFEGTGGYGRSHLARLGRPPFQVLQRVELDQGLFGEGITVLNERLYQLTWRSGRGFVYDSRNLKRLASFDYAGEGWGLAHDGERLFMSDGSASLRILDPHGLTRIGTLRVRAGKTEIPFLNELEYMNGEILANVWPLDFIARISPHSGALLGWLDLRPLRKLLPEAQTAGVLNGIAYDTREQRLYVTGKNWPHLFEISWQSRPPDG